MSRLKIDANAKINNLKIITKRLVNTTFFGDYKSVFKGRGLEFEGFRDYTMEDDAISIDWKASKRANKLLVREFIEERNLDVFFLIDVSSNMLTSSTKKLKSEYSAELISTIAFSVLGAGDKVGFALFSKGLIKESVLSNKKSQFYTLIESLTNSENYSDYFNLPDALNYLSDHIRKNTLVFIVSDFITPFGWEDDLKLVSQKFDIIGIMIRDPRDLTLPDSKGLVVLKDPYTQERLVVEPKQLKKFYELEVKNQIDYIQKQFVESNSDFLTLVTDKDFLDPLFQLFNNRKKKWR